RRVVIVGGSLAGLRAAETLRREGFDGRLSVTGRERHRPYDRPPLSKEVLSGRRAPETISLRKPEAWEELEVDWRLGCRALSLDLERRAVRLEGGEELGFDGLVIATGATPRTLPGTAGLAGIHVLRTLDDCLALRAELERGPRVAVVGAGFIGAEVAATCRERGLHVTLLEALAAPLVRGIGPELGALVAEVHRDHGVDVRCGVGVAGFEGKGQVDGVRLSDGNLVRAEVVVVGVGVVPETAWLEGSGLRLADGVLCDAACATPAEGVVAAGDIARWAHPGYEQPIRLEHWTNAVEQGVAAAQRLLAGTQGAKPFAPVPYVWSDQYDLKIQIAGLPRGDCALRIVDGTVGERRFVALFERAGQLVAAVGFGRSRQLMGYRMQIAEQLRRGRTL
ncbi:MAG TPA: FAD/NAD(P)-binding oxidoreductase, partial [Myxococcota bacterium]|nr:FAD/NAD(P)-binding oxidoreductase [Myxococcota bacterium]